MAGNGDAVRPDKQTKLVTALLYGAMMGILSFLAFQVWTMNGSIGRLEERYAARSEVLAEMKAEMRDLRNALSSGLDAIRREFRDEMHKAAVVPK